MQKVGIMIMSGFAALWFVWGISAAGLVSTAWLLVPFVISGAMIVLAMRLKRVANPAERRHVGRVVGWASGVECAGILVANNVLVWTGHAGFAVCATLAIVGLHFLPLAHFLRVRAYYGTAAALVGLAAAGLAIGDDRTRLLVVATGAAVLLWLTCLAAFGRGVAKA